MLVMPPPPQLSFDVEGLSSHLQDAVTELLFEQAGRDVEICVVAGGARGAAKNALIARAQANRNRDPFYLNPGALGAIGELAGQIFAAARDARQRLFDTVGDVMLASIQVNVDGQRNPGGQAFRALSLAYARRKQRQFGFTIPILRATGDLLRGLKVVVTKQ